LYIFALIYKPFKTEIMAKITYPNQNSVGYGTNQGAQVPPAPAEANRFNEIKASVNSLYDALEELEQPEGNPMFTLFSDGEDISLTPRNNLGEKVSFGEPVRNSAGNYTVDISFDQSLEFDEESEFAIKSSLTGSDAIVKTMRIVSENVLELAIVTSVIADNEGLTITPADNVLSDTLFEIVLF